MLKRKKRFYPFCQNTPLLCYSKHLYYFMKVIGGGYKPRIIKGDGVWGYDPSLSQIIKMILNIDYTPSLPVSSKYHFNSKDEWEVLEKVSRLKIAKSLKIFNVRDVHQLISVMKDTNELQTLYKYLANPIAASVKIDSPESFFIQMTHLWEAVATCTDNPKEIMIIRDYIQDLFILKKKDFSFKIKSINRIKDAHKITSRLIRLRSVKDIKVDPKYDEAFERLQKCITEAELIKTKDRLLHEGVSQDHCVVSYADKINKGNCCIISIPWNNAQWTLELGYMKEGIFNVRQCRGLRNASAPPDLMELLYKTFQTHGYVEADIRDNAFVGYA